jgi:glucosamine-6-phosphate deaminase
MGSSVEKTMLERTGQKRRYPNHEGTAVFIVDNFPMLGTFAAARFLEWVQGNPGGVISLPTGKTPQYFIHEVNRFLKGWHEPEVGKELAAHGIDTATKPDMSSLRFVQIDEFYPVNPRHTNSFYYYVEKYYLEGFGIPRENSLLINTEGIGIPKGMSLEDVWGDDAVDLSLRYRHPKTRREEVQKNVIHRVDEWCAEYEDRIRSLGGIGFFLGGIGPDGHIAFNVQGSDFHSTTRLAPINYETQAASASDLGGIEVAKKRLTITIGLSTITYNKNAVAIVLAAGEAKAGTVAEAVESSKSILRPATALHDLKNAAFYLTRGAAKRLIKRGVEQLNAQEEIPLQDQHQIVIDAALKRERQLSDLSDQELKDDPFGAVLLRKTTRSPSELIREVEQSIRDKFNDGMHIRRNKRFLHTEPHHDDVMLGYLPYVVRHIREHSNAHYFATFTSGFTAVTNGYMLQLSRRLREALQEDRYDFESLTRQGYFDAENSHFRDHDVWLYLDGLAAQSEDMMEEGTLRRFYRDLVSIFEDSDKENLIHRVDELINYFETQYPGKKDLSYIQTLKGMVREYESECLWGYFGWNSEAIDHLRLGFYKGEIFTEDPSVPRDVIPVLELLRKIEPDVVTVAFDPEASGPDTHYKVLQSVAEALRLYREETGRDDIEVWGYRNVWYRFDLADANILVPVSLNMLTLQHQSFMSTYISQKSASFPSYEYEGPFSLLAQRIQVGQYEQLATLLGRNFFYEHDRPLVRATRGIVYLKSMTLDEFFTHSRALRSQAEARE